MECAAHLAAERLIDELVLLHPRLAAERFGDDGCGIMVAVAGEVANRHLGVRDPGLDQPLDLARPHGHCAAASLRAGSTDRQKAFDSLRSCPRARWDVVATAS